MLLIGPHQTRRHQLVHRDSANAATRNITPDAHLEIVHDTVSSTHKRQHAVGCEYIHTRVDGCEFTIYDAVCVCLEICGQFIAACNEIPAWSTQGFGCTVREIKHNQGVSSRIFADQFRERHPR